MLPDHMSEPIRQSKDNPLLARRRENDTNMTYQEILADMQAEFQTLTGVLADDAADIGIRLKVLASQLEELSKQVDEQYRQLFPQTATGSYLEMHGQLRGVIRKTAQQATGTLTFSRGGIVDYDVSIPQGTICALEGNLEARFQTTQDAVLTAGTNSVTVPAKAQEGGTRYNVPAASVAVMISPPLGVISVTNPIPFTGGTNEEDDEELRERLLKTYSEISNGTNAAFYRDVAMSYPEITSCTVISRARGRGTVDVVVASGGSPPDSQLLGQIEADLQARREISVDVALKPVVPKPLTVTGSITVKNGYSINHVLDDCRDAVSNYFSSLQIGEKLLIAALGAALFSVKGVANYHISLPSSDQSLQPDELFLLSELQLEGEMAS